MVSASDTVPFRQPDPGPSDTGHGASDSDQVLPLLARARAAAAAVTDPEIPVVTLEDLGILRSVSLAAGRIQVVLTPTYTGCPATDAIRDEVARALERCGVRDPDIRIELAPAWTTDWISPTGRDKLKQYGIAPPQACAQPGDTASAVLRFVARPRSHKGLACPRCEAHAVELVSDYGSTPCKALYRCLSCREPFDYFKPY